MQFIREKKHLRKRQVKMDLYKVKVFCATISNLDTVLYGLMTGFQKK